MTLLFCYGVVIVIVLAIRRAKERERRIDDEIDWIINPEKRLRELSKKDRGYGIRRTDDEIIIDLQPDGYDAVEHDDEVIIEDLHTDGFIVVDESEGHKERFDC